MATLPFLECLCHETQLTFVDIGQLRQPILIQTLYYVLLELGWHLAAYVRTDHDDDQTRLLCRVASALTLINIIVSRVCCVLDLQLAVFQGNEVPYCLDDCSAAGESMVIKNPGMYLQLMVHLLR